MKKTLFYFFVFVVIFAGMWTLTRPIPVKIEPDDITTKYGAFLASQHAIYVNDFESASNFASQFSDVSYKTPRRTYYLAQFLNGVMPDNPENLAKETDAASRIIYDAYLVKNSKWDALYNRHNSDKSALYAPFRIWSGIAKKRVTETLKYIDSLDSNSSWKSFIRGQIYAETGDIQRATKEFEKVQSEFMNINDYTYIMSFYKSHNFTDLAELLRKDFTSNAGGMFMTSYDDFPDWKTFSGPQNALAFDLIQSVSHTKVMLFSDLSVLMLRFAQIITDNSPWFNDSINYYMGQFFSNTGRNGTLHFENLSQSNPFFLFAQMHAADESDSVDALKNILEKQPLFIPAINKLVAIYTGKGDKSAALRVLHNALKNPALSDSGRIYLLKRRALVYLLFDDLNRAQSDIHEAAKSSKTDSEILTIQARIWTIQKREIENAYDYAMTMVKHDPTDIVAWDTLAFVVSEREGNDAALDILTRVGRTANSCSSLFEHLGDAYARNGDKKMASEAYIRAIELSSDGLSVAPKIRKKLRKVK
ncbi:MAG: hypothetical protein J5742_02510 [Alphaproteobacteria bacterium]|nr:hypothetical protein [Alphaproteobacteria bacterium]